MFPRYFFMVGIETIRINNSSYECYKVHLSVSGIFGALLGKTTLHYSTRNPGFLVRSEGISGPPGSPRVIMELIEYQAQ